jgi:putative DNA primase/helicase
MSGEKEPIRGHEGRPKWLRAVYSPDDDLQPDELIDSLLDRTADEMRRIKSNLTNIVLILDQDHRWKGKIRTNTFTLRVEVDGEHLIDEIEGELAIWLNNNYAFEPTIMKVHTAVRIVATSHPYHPVRDYLRGLEWDKRCRLDSMLARHLGSPETPLTAVLGMKWAIGAVARIMDPGCKVDTMIVLAGKQGIKKSTWLSTMAVKTLWFSDSSIEFRNKDAYQSLPGVWIYELSEMHSAKRSDNSAVKAFLSSRVDRYRPSYGRCTVDVPRQTAFVGSTNEAEFLTDPTGARRFWPVPVEEVDLDLARSERDQIWAEAVAAYDAGEQWWLTQAEGEELAVESERYYQSDPWEAIVAHHLLGEDETTITEILCGPLDRPKSAQNKSDQMRLGGILSKLGWSKRRKQSDGVRAYVWRRDDWER